MLRRTLHSVEPRSSSSSSSSSEPSHPFSFGNLQPSILMSESMEASKVYGGPDTMESHGIVEVGDTSSEEKTAEGKKEEEPLHQHSVPISQIAQQTHVNVLHTLWVLQRQWLELENLIMSQKLTPRKDTQEGQKKKRCQYCGNTSEQEWVERPDIGSLCQDCNWLLQHKLSKQEAFLRLYWSTFQYQMPSNNSNSQGMTDQQPGSS